MKILFVVPTIPQLAIARSFEPVGSKVFRVPFLGVLTAASCVSQRHEVTVVDEHIERVDLDFDCDLVGLTIATPTTRRAWEIAREFRRRGRKVFAGGFHVTFNADEALQHVDSVVVGEAENSIQRLVADAERGALKPRYESEGLCAGADIPPINQRLIRHPEQYFTTNVLHTSRGCVFKCDFCGVRLFYRDTYRRRPIDAVLEELRAFKGRKVLFTDDNLIGDLPYAKELFRRMIPLKKWWMGQMSINCARDPELLDLARRAGCFGVFIGFETIDQATLAQVDKHQNRAVDYKEVVRILHRHGLPVAAGTIFGFDNDERTVFRKTADFFLDAGLDCIQVDPLTAFPGTPLFEKLEAEGRILSDDWDRYNIAETVFAPRRMSAEELDAGVDYVRRRFYTLPNLARRFLRVLWYRRSLPAALVVSFINYGYWRHLRQKIGYPP